MYPNILSLFNMQQLFPSEVMSKSYIVFNFRNRICDRLDKYRTEGFVCHLK